MYEACFNTSYIGYFWLFQCSWSSHGNVVGGVTTLRVGRSGDRIAGGAKDNVQADNWVHLTSYSIATGEKSPGREADHSTPSSVEFKSEWSCTSAPLPVFTA